VDEDDGDHEFERQAVRARMNQQEECVVESLEAVHALGRKAHRSAQAVCRDNRQHETRERGAADYRKNQLAVSARNQMPGVSRIDRAKLQPEIEPLADF